MTRLPAVENRKKINVSVVPDIEEVFQGVQSWSALKEKIDAVIAEKVPEQYRSQVIVNFSYDRYEEDPNLTFELTYERPQTDEEILKDREVKARMRAAKNWKDNEDNLNFKP